MNSHSFEDLSGGEETLLAGLVVKNLCRFSEYEPGMLYMCLCSVQADVLASSSTRKNGYSDPVWTTPRVGSNFPFFQNIPVREMMESHSELSLVRLYFL